MAIVAVLVMRAIGEWRETNDREAGRTCALTTSDRSVNCASSWRVQPGSTPSRPVGRLGSGRSCGSRHQVQPRRSGHRVRPVHRGTGRRTPPRRIDPTTRSSARRGRTSRGTSGLEWHIDPIDGTVNFVYDLPCWCTSVAVLRDGDRSRGAVYAPVVDELYSAGLGHGATVNGDDGVGLGSRHAGHRRSWAPASAITSTIVASTRPNASPGCCPTCATSVVRGPQRSTSHTLRAVGSTPTSRSSSTPGTSPPGS